MLTQVFYCECKVSFHITTQLLEFSTFSRLPSMPSSYVVAFKHVTYQIRIHEIQNKMKCILFNQWPRDIYFSCPITLPNLQWLPDHEWRTRLLFRDEKNYSAFTYHQIDQSIKCSQSTTYWVGEPNNCLAALIKYQSIQAAQNQMKCTFPAPNISHQHICCWIQLNWIT